MELNVTVEGKEQLLASLLKVEKGVVDLRQLGTWDWVQSEYYKVVKEQFDSEGASGKSGKWKELHPKYKEYKLKNYGDLPILQRSGALYKSLTTAGGFGAVVEKRPQEMTLGSTLKTAVWHQEGRGRNPVRKMLDLSPEQEKRITQPVVEKLKQLIDNARLRDERGF